jgi:uncharacterized protein (TIGR01244 family)
MLGTRQYRPLSLLVLAASIWIQGAGAQTAPQSAGAPGALVNARRPLPGVLTGGLGPDQDYARLAGEGFKTVVDLRSRAEVAAGTDAAARGAGLAYLSIPIAGEADLDLAAARALRAILKQPDSYPIVLACASGNRVGALLALEKFWLENWPAEEALLLGQSAGLTRLEPAVRFLLGLPAAQPAPDPPPVRPSR